MDANGSHFQLFLTAADWGRWRHDGVPLSELWNASPPAGPPVVWNEGELTLQPRLFRFVAAAGDTAVEPKQRRGAAADRFGNFYWIDDNQRDLYVQSVGTSESSRFWPPATPPTVSRRGDFFGPSPVPREPPRLTTLAVTVDHHLAVATTSPKGILIFDLFAGGPPTHLLWPNAIEFAPFDMAARPSGGVWILDRYNRRFWGFDRAFRVLRDEQAEPPVTPGPTDIFQPTHPGPPRGGAPQRAFPEGLAYDAASPFEVEDAIAIEALPDDSVLILDRNPSGAFSQMVHQRFGRRLGPPLSLEVVASLIEEGEDRGFGLSAHDFVRVPGDKTSADQLVIAGSEGNQAFSFWLNRASNSDGTIDLVPVPKYLPMRRFGGKGLLVSAGRVHYDFATGWVPLTCQGRPRYRTQAVLDLADATAAKLDERARPASAHLDSGEPDCVWHRLLLDATIPAETSVACWSRAANEPGTLTTLPWSQEPEFYQRRDGSELPWVPEETAASEGGPATRTGTWELLFQRARGRYLQLRLVIAGNERATPRLRALRVWHPRFSYAQNYLPAVYREDANSGDFFDRFLANPEGFFTAIEDRVATVQALFDWRSAPAETLDWLARWFDASLDPAWDERRRRLFVRYAVQFFQFRGTIHGLRMALALALDPAVAECQLQAPGRIPESRQSIRVVERYLTRRMPGLLLGEPMRDVGPRQVPVRARWQPDEGVAGLNERFADAVAASTGRPTRQPFRLVPPSSRTDLAPWEAVVSKGDSSEVDFLQRLAAAARADWTAFAEAVVGFVPTAADEQLGWQRFLVGHYSGKLADLNAAHATGYASFGEVRLPRDLTAATMRADWRAFVAQDRTGATGRQRLLWQEFIARRYRQIAALNGAYQTHFTGFAEVPLPDVLPNDGAALADWYQYESVLKSIQRDAHRFSVFIPTSGPSADPATLAARLALARRIIELSKPAHTVFEVGFYWALFRLGEARLGFDTLIDEGSRAQQLMPPFVLGRNSLGEAHLPRPAGHPGPQRTTLECHRTA